MKNYQFINAFDIATEEAIMLHAYEPALVRRTKERTKANKYKASNADFFEGADERLLGKYKYRDYRGYCNRWNYFDYDLCVEARRKSKHAKNEIAELAYPTTKVEKTIQPQPAIIPATDDDYQDYFESDTETQSFPLIFFVIFAVISAIVMATAK